MYYWDKYYKKIYYTRKPSTFVKFLVKKKLIRKNNKKNNKKPVSL